MKERQEPTISTLPPEQDEPPRPGPSDPRPKKRPKPPPVSGRPVVVRSPLGPLALLLAVGALAFGGYSYWMLMQTQESLASSQQMIATADLRIQELERQLTISDDESTQSLTAIQANVRENASEIRKLWGVSYDRNRNAIAALQTSVKDLTESISSVDQRVTSGAEEIAKVSDGVTEVTGEVRVLSELLNAQQSAIDSAAGATQQEALIERVNALESDLVRRVTGNEEAIEAIDAFRVQVNRDLQSLKGG